MAEGAGCHGGSLFSPCFSGPAGFPSRVTCSRKRNRRHQGDMLPFRCRERPAGVLVTSTPVAAPASRTPGEPGSPGAVAGPCGTAFAPPWGPPRAGQTLSSPFGPEKDNHRRGAFPRSCLVFGANGTQRMPSLFISSHPSAAWGCYTIELGKLSLSIGTGPGRSSDQSRALDHFHSSGRATKPRRTGFL